MLIFYEQRIQSRKMDALFLWEIRAIVKKSVWKCRILEKTHHLIHLIFESADSNMENIKERKRKRGKEKGTILCSGN